MLVSDDDETDWEEEEIGQPWTDSEEGQPEIIELSLNLVVGLLTPKTMKFRGLIAYEVIVLIYSRATHNFISLRIDERLSIPIVPTAGFGVQVAIGEWVRGKGLCREVVLSLSILTIVKKLLPLKLGGAELYLCICIVGPKPE